MFASHILLLLLSRALSDNRTRGAKKDELRDLERKLVVLLEEQQIELNAIKKRQEMSASRVVADTMAVVKGSKASGRPGSRSAGSDTSRAAGTVDDVDRGEGGGPTPQQVGGHCCRTSGQRALALWGGGGGGVAHAFEGIYVVWWCGGGG